MWNEADEARSCGPQLLPEGQPNNEWGLDQLSVYAQLQYRQIIDGETGLARCYWRLGHVLILAKNAFGHGQWTRYLHELRIDKTRATRARAIRRTFADEEQVAQLTVEDAYAQRERKRSAKAGSEEPSEEKTPVPKDVQGLRRSVSRIAKQAGTVIHDAAFAEREEAVILIPAVRKAIRELQQLLQFLEQQADEPPQLGDSDAAGSQPTAEGSALEAPESTKPRGEAQWGG
jgi:hypothetical protein